MKVKCGYVAEKRAEPTEMAGNFRKEKSSFDPFASDCANEQRLANGLSSVSLSNVWCHYENSQCVNIARTQKPTINRYAGNRMAHFRRKPERSFQTIKCGASRKPKEENIPV